MKHLQKTISIALLVTICSCKKLIFAYHGIHSPKQISIPDIEKFAAKKKIPLEGSAMIHEDSILYAMGTRMNDAFLFDANGYLINFNKSFENQACGGNITNFLAGLDTLTYVERDSNRTLAQESGMWQLFGKPEPFPPIPLNGKPQYHYYVAYYWNTFSGNPNHRNAIKDLRETIQNNKRVKIKLLLINHDIRFGIDEEKFARRAQRYAGVKVEVKP